MAGNIEREECVGESARERVGAQEKVHEKEQARGRKCTREREQVHGRNRAQEREQARGRNRAQERERPCGRNRVKISLTSERERNRKPRGVDACAPWRGADACGPRQYFPNRHWPAARAAASSVPPSSSKRSASSVPLSSCIGLQQ